MQHQQDTNEGGAAEMPRYECHKQVWALKIKDVEKSDDPYFPAQLVPEEAGYAPIKVSAGFLSKHNPQIGGYYVVYKDGYASYSPAKAFEEGYTRV